MYLLLQNRLMAHVRAFLKQKYDIELANIVVEQPPKIELGEFALPVSFELARTLRKAPRKIAEEIVAEIGRAGRIRQVRGGGSGIHQRAAGPERGGGSWWRAWRRMRGHPAKSKVNYPTLAKRRLYVGHPIRGKVLVEHTSINPNKAAHIGHLRNSILGDTLVRLLRAAKYKVAVQNYIDNTGVQVADVVVGFERVAKKTRAEIEA